MFVQVIAPIGSYKSFTYSVPRALRDGIGMGAFVVVPFGNRTMTGVVGRIETRTAFKGPIKPITALRTDIPPIPSELATTLSWISRYYFTPLGIVMKSAFPLGFSSRSPVRTRSYAALTDDGKQALTRWTRRAPAQKAVLQYLAQRKNPVPLQQLSGIVASPHSICGKLQAAGLVSISQHDLVSDPLSGFARPTDRQVTLNDEQDQILSALKTELNKKDFTPCLLRGVTGSGKTEIYLQAVRDVVQAGHSALVLVPEIALTPQVGDRFRGAFGDKVALWHSNLTRAQRVWTWRQLLHHRFQVVVGARSAVFAPLHNLRLIIVDEEQEGSYKQEEPAPRYHARDVALMRGKHVRATVLLASATPSVDSYYNSLMGRFQSLTLSKRFGGAVYPRVRLVDLNAERQRTGNYELILSDPLIKAMEERLARHEQVILLQNRRGFAPVIKCTDCAYIEICPHCAILLTYHKAAHTLKCHYCGYLKSAPASCPECNSPHIVLGGVGTEKVEEVLRQQFSGAAVCRMDTDTTQKRGAHHRLLQKFREGKYDILLGTQMIAKGLDFENVTLVGVVNADTGLFMPDFRAGERTFQLVYQVCGRAGRHPEKPGIAIIQTNTPGDIAIQAAARLNAHRFYNQVLAERQELAYPPFARQIRLLLQGKNQEGVWERARQLRSLITPVQKGMSLLGPSSAPLERLRGYWRVHLLLKSSRENDPAGQRLHRFISSRIPQSWMERSRTGVRLIIDVDPATLL